MFAAFSDQGFHGIMKILGQNISAGWLHKSVKHDLISASRGTKNAISPIGIIQILFFCVLASCSEAKCASFISCKKVTRLFGPKASSSDFANS